MEIFVTVMIAVLLTMVLHWFPWRALIGRDLPRPASYTLGILATMGPASALLLLLSNQRPDYFATLSGLDVLGVIWLIFLAVGLTVLIVNALDGFLETRARMRSAEKEGESLRKRMVNDEQTKGFL